MVTFTREAPRVGPAAGANSAAEYTLSSSSLEQSAALSVTHTVASATSAPYAGAAHVTRVSETYCAGVSIGRAPTVENLQSEGLSGGSTASSVS
jgi:hypothetical protein